MMVMMMVVVVMVVMMYIERAVRQWTSFSFFIFIFISF